MTRGWWGLACFNGLSAEQQHRLVTWGNLEFGYTPEGECQAGAAIGVECDDDEYPGPRFYCLDCAIGYLTGKQQQAIAQRPHTPL